MMEELLYTPKTLAWIICVRDMGMRSASDFLNNVWTYEAEYLLPEHKYSKKKFHLDVMDYVNYIQDKEEFDSEMAAVNNDLRTMGSDTEYYAEDLGDMTFFFIYLRLRILFFTQHHYVRMKLRTMIGDHGYKRRTAELTNYLRNCLYFYHIETYTRGWQICDIGEIDLDDMITFRAVGIRSDIDLGIKTPDQSDGASKDSLGDNEGVLLSDADVLDVSDYVVFDLETTGTSSISDSIIEISAIKIKDGKSVDVFSSLVNPEKPISVYASSVNGITDDMVKDAPVIECVLQQFLDFIGSSALVGHNIRVFDMKFIYRDSRKYFGKVPVNNYVDTLLYARRHLPGMENYKLTTLAEYYGVSTGGAHRALSDCRMNYLVFEHLKQVQSQNENTGRKCPMCGKKLVKREGRFGDFLGCSGFPDCRYTENL